MKACTLNTADIIFKTLLENIHCLKSEAIFAKLLAYPKKKHTKDIFIYKAETLQTK